VKRQGTEWKIKAVVCMSDKGHAFRRHKEMYNSSEEQQQSTKMGKG
jgi:hypothetical protein